MKNKKDQQRLKIIMAMITLLFIVFFLLMLGLSLRAQASLVEDFESEPEPEMQPIYYVYKNGTRVDACPEIQWMVWHLAGRHGYDHRYIFGLIIRESTFRPNSHNQEGNWRGLTQIHPFWTRNRLLTDFRLTDDHAERCLFDPTDNILTLIEMWNYAVYTYDIDISTEQGMAELLWWHFSGRYVEGIQHWEITRTLNFIEELVPNPQPFYELGGKDERQS